MKIKKNGKIHELEKCPYCGYDEYYQQVYISGKTIYRKRFIESPMNKKGDREVVDNSGLFDSLEWKTYKTVYCDDCGEKLGIIVD